MATTGHHKYLDTIDKLTSKYQDDDDDKSVDIADDSDGSDGDDDRSVSPSPTPLPVVDPPIPPIRHRHLHRLGTVTVHQPPSIPKRNIAKKGIEVKHAATPKPLIGASEIRHVSNTTKDGSWVTKCEWRREHNLHTRFFYGKTEAAANWQCERFIKKYLLN
jgi:hypothetical protein